MKPQRGKARQGTARHVASCKRRERGKGREGAGWYSFFKCSAASGGNLT